jgi:glycosyltransferase involved in cell wall biosynthesis
LDCDLHKTALLHTLSHLSKNGNDASLIALQSREKYINNNKSVRVTPIPLRYKPFVTTVMFATLLTVFLPISALLSKAEYIIFDPDVHILSAFPALLALSIKKTKFILDIRTLPVETKGLSGRLKKFWFSISVLTAKHFFDGITIITPSMKNKVCVDYNIDPSKVGVWTSGVSKDLFNPEQYRIQREELRRTFGLNEKFIVFYHGVFSATRGLLETVEALKLLRTKYPNIIFYLLGSGPLAPKLKTAIEDEGLQNTVIIANPVSHMQVPRYITMADVTIVPLPNHPFWQYQSPLKLLEYLAMEKSVILSDIEAHRSVIGQNKCGIYLSSTRPIDIANAIEYAFENKDYLNQWGESGRKIILESYTWEKVVETLEKYLSEIK